MIMKCVTGPTEDVLTGRMIRSDNPCLCRSKGHLVFFPFILRDYGIVQQLFSGSTWILGFMPTFSFSLFYFFCNIKYELCSSSKPACRPHILLFSYKVFVTCRLSKWVEPIATGVGGQSAFPLQQNYEQDGWLSHDINIYLSMCPSRNELRGMWLKGCVIHAFNSIDLLI